MKTEQLPNGNLRLSINDAERVEFDSMASRNEFDADATMYDLFEHFMANSEYEWIAPEEIGALTDAPIIGTRDQDGKPVSAWGFMNYQIESLQRALLERGEAILTIGM